MLSDTGRTRHRYERDIPYRRYIIESESVIRKSYHISKGKVKCLFYFMIPSLFKSMKIFQCVSSNFRQTESSSLIDFPTK